MNEPTNKELLDSLGVEVEIKKENQFTSINEHVFSGFEEIQDFLKIQKEFQKINMTKTYLKEFMQ